MSDDPDWPNEPATLGEDVRQLIDDGRALAAAELSWQKARVAFAGWSAGGIALFGALAAAFGVFALVALTVGALLALTPQLGAWGAVGAVAGTLLLAAILCGAVAALRVRRTARLIADRRQP